VISCLEMHIPPPLIKSAVIYIFSNTPSWKGGHTYGYVIFPSTPPIIYTYLVHTANPVTLIFSCSNQISNLDGDEVINNVGTTFSGKASLEIKCLLGHQCKTVQYNIFFPSCGFPRTATVMNCRSVVQLSSHQCTGAGIS
jgi:hypothetical protein